MSYIITLYTKVFTLSAGLYSNQISKSVVAILVVLAVLAYSETQHHVSTVNIY